jgi:hypothetical protein
MKGTLAETSLLPDPVAGNRAWVHFSPEVNLLFHQIDFNVLSEVKMRWVPPFNHLSSTARKRALIITLVMSAILLLAMRTLDAPLRTHMAPSGIVSFEMAGNDKVSKQILDSWSTEAKINAALSLGLDFLFLIVYALFISLSCVQIAAALKDDHSIFFRTAVILAWAQFLAAILDATENLALIHLLLNSSSRWLPCLARWCAIIKFSIVGAGLIFIFAGLLVIGLKKIFQRAI